MCSVVVSVVMFGLLFLNLACSELSRFTHLDTLHQQYDLKLLDLDIEEVANPDRICTCSWSLWSLAEQIPAIQTTLRRIQRGVR